MGVQMNKEWKTRISIDENILAGKPIIKGTRISVELILELLANGWTHKQILDNYPQLTREDIEAALRYATEILQDELVYPYP
jgi:uncharacterized protein (DUF433 family)